MGISSKTRKLLWGRSGNRCVVCRQLLILGKEDGFDSVVGDEAHICSSRRKGPRWQAVVLGGIDGYDNFILLCKVHHKVVDDQPETYTREILTTLKKNHEAWVESTIEAIVKPDGTSSSDAGTSRLGLEDYHYKEKSRVYRKLLKQCSDAVRELDYSSTPFTQIHDFKDKGKWEKYFLKEITPLYHLGFDLEEAAQENSTVLSKKVMRGVVRFSQMCLRYVTNAAHFDGGIMLDTQSRLLNAFEGVQRCMRDDLHIDDLERGIKSRLVRKSTQ